MRNKENLLFLILGGFFVTNALIAEFIGVKIFSLEKTLGFEPILMEFFGEKNLSFNLTAGVLLWPVVFIMTDVINEYFGKRGVKFLSYLAVGLISYAFVMVTLAIGTIPADFWVATPLYTEKGLDINLAFQMIFSQGNWIIIGSLVAFLIGQVVDVTVFHYLRRFTGPRMIWLRATGSTLVSQLIDSFVVLYIAFALSPANWPMSLVLAVCTVNYIYKFIMAIGLTPLLYVFHWGIDRFLGKELAEKLKEEAAV